MAQKHAVANKKKIPRKAMPVGGVHHIEVHGVDNATVTTTPTDRTVTSVKFTSNSADSVIVYRKESPIAEMRAEKPFSVGKSSGPFKCVKKGRFHFDCGHFLDDGSFEPWSGTTGDDTDSGDGGPK